MTGNIIANLALGLFPLIAVSIYLCLTPQRATFVSLLLGFLFLPRAVIPVAGLPNIDNYFVLFASLLFCIAVFDRKALTNFRWTWADSLLIALAVTRLASPIISGIGVYSGLTPFLRTLLDLGTPYLVARVYIRDIDSFHLFARILFSFTVIYALIGLWEVRMAPTLGARIYGVSHSFLQQVRGGGYRPVAFLFHGLLYAYFIVQSIILIYAFRKTSRISPQERPMIFSGFAIIALIALLTKTAMAYLLLALVFCSLFLVFKTKNKIYLYAIVMTPALYLCLRVTSSFDPLLAGSMLEFVGVSEERIASFLTRTEHENFFVSLPQAGTWFGHGDGTWRLTADKENTITDSLWIITYLTYGSIGLILRFAIFLLPAFLLIRKLDLTATSKKDASILAVSLVMLLLCAQLNNVVNVSFPVFSLLAVGIASNLLLNEQAFIRKKRVENDPLLSDPTPLLEGPRLI